MGNLEKITSVNVKQSNGEYVKYPVSAGGYVTPQMYGAKGDGVTDDTEAFKAAINSGDNVIIPNASYNLTQYIWTDDSVVLIDLGNYQSGEGKLIISKSLTDGPVYEKMVTEFNPYWDSSTNNTTTLFNNDDKYLGTDYKINNDGQIIYQTVQGVTRPAPAGTAGTLINRRLQGVCYIDEYDIFAFGFCQTNSNVQRALLAFYRLTENNTFEYKGHGIVNHGGHLNSMCCRVEDKRTGKKAASDIDQTYKVVCVYSSCAVAGSRNVPPTPSNGTAISVYGGGRIQIGRIPIIKNGDTYSIPNGDEFAQLVTAGDYGHYQDPEDDDDRYNQITYFCGVNSDVQSQNRTMMRMTYDSDTDLFYIESSKLGTVQTYQLKPFSLVKNWWIEHKRNPAGEQIYTGVANINLAREEAFDKLGIFSQLDKNEIALGCFDGQGPLVINNQLIHACYISKQVKHHGIYNNGILIMQYNYATQGLKKIYRIPCPIATHQPQCLAHGKKGRIYLINDLGRSGTLGNKTIRITQLSFNKEVCSTPENPYFEPKKLDTYYAQYRGGQQGSGSDLTYYIDLDYLTEVGAYIYGGDNSMVNYGDANMSKVQAEYQGKERKIKNGPGDSKHYFTLYVLPLVEYSRLQVYVSQHGEIYVRNLWTANSGVKQRSGWRQLIETGRASSARTGTWFGTGYLSSVRVLRFTIPFPTHIYSNARGTPSVTINSLIMRQVGASVTVDISQLNSATTITADAWGYNVELHSNNELRGNNTNFSTGVVGIQVNLSITF